MTGGAGRSAARRTLCVAQGAPTRPARLPRRMASAFMTQPDSSSGGGLAAPRATRAPSPPDGLGYRRSGIRRCSLQGWHAQAQQSPCAEPGGRLRRHVGVRSARRIWHCGALQDGSSHNARPGGHGLGTGAPRCHSFRGCRRGHECWRRHMRRWHGRKSCPYCRRDSFRHGGAYAGRRYGGRRKRGVAGGFDVEIGGGVFRRHMPRARGSSDVAGDQQSCAACSDYPSHILRFSSD